MSPPHRPRTPTSCRSGSWLLGVLAAAVAVFFLPGRTPEQPAPPRPPSERELAVGACRMFVEQRTAGRAFDSIVAAENGPNVWTVRGAVSGDYFECVMSHVEDAWILVDITVE